VNSNKKKRNKKENIKNNKKILLIIALGFVITIVIISSLIIFKKNTKCKNGTYLYLNECRLAVDVKEPLVLFSCPDDFTLNNDTNTCDKIEEVDAKNDKACPDGYTLSNDSCTKNETEGASIYYTCPNGGTLNGTKCTGRTQTNAKVTTTCPKGYMLIDPSSSKCVIYTTPSYDTNKGSYYCFYKFYTLNVLEDGRMVCWDSTITADEIISYSCSSGTLEGDKCITDVNYDAIRKVDCRPGWSA
jgi:conjugal transfer mating pair stabilization protein TraN